MQFSGLVFLITTLISSKSIYAASSISCDLSQRNTGCAADQYCSEDGFCEPLGKTPSLPFLRQHHGHGNSHILHARLRYSKDATCGPNHGNTVCASSSPNYFGTCCSSHGYCGNSADHCGEGCVSGCTRQWVYPNNMGTCGPNNDMSACDASSPYGGCCSAAGYCGSTPEHCLVENGCQHGCTNEVTTSSKDSIKSSSSTKKPSDSRTSSKQNTSKSASSKKAPSSSSSKKISTATSASPPTKTKTSSTKKTPSNSSGKNTSTATHTSSATKKNPSDKSTSSRITSSSIKPSESGSWTLAHINSFVGSGRTQPNPAFIKFNITRTGSKGADVACSLDWVDGNYPVKFIPCGSSNFAARIPSGGYHAPYNFTLVVRQSSSTAGVATVYGKRQNDCFADTGCSFVQGVSGVASASWSAPQQMFLSGSNPL